MTKVLKMQFEGRNGSKSTVTLPDPKAGLGEEEIKTAMLSIIEKDIFENLHGSYVAPINAKIVSTTEEVFDLA